MKQIECTINYRRRKFRRISQSRNFVVGNFDVLIRINSVHEKISFELANLGEGVIYKEHGPKLFLSKP